MFSAIFLREGGAWNERFNRIEIGNKRGSGISA